MTASLAAVLAASAALANDAADPTALEIFGWVERVEIADGKLSVKAKLDTGAATSSLDASDIELVERGDENWVRFVVSDPDTGEAIALERPLERRVRIIQHTGRHQRRPVITLPVCFGHFYEEVEFSLIDRSNFIYPVLLGRNALRGRGLVDSQETFINYPTCGNAGTDE